MPKHKYLTKEMLGEVIETSQKRQLEKQIDPRTARSLPADVEIPITNQKWAPGTGHIVRGNAGGPLKGQEIDIDHDHWEKMPVKEFVNV